MLPILIVCCPFKMACQQFFDKEFYRMKGYMYKGIKFICNRQKKKYLSPHTEHLSIAHMFFILQN